MDMYDNFFAEPGRQRVYDRYDALSDACWNLAQGMEALRAFREELEPDAMAALQDIASTLERERDGLRAQLERIDADDD